MLWPLVLPAQIAFWTLIVVVISITAMAPSLKWKSGKTFIISSFIALVAFIPSCIGIMFVVDEIRFGYFEYETFSDINDFRAERYLPTAAADIKMHKYANGYRAQYSISESDFHAYLDNLWDEYGEYSSVKRGEMSGEGLTVSSEELERIFPGLEWKPTNNAIEYHSPTEADGGGAEYYFDRETGIAFEWTGYW